MKRFLPHPRPPLRSDRARQVAQWFGLRTDSTQAAIGAPTDISADLLDSILPCPGEIALISGASGSGKSSLLAALRGRASAASWIELDAIALPDLPLVDVFGEKAIEESLVRLAQVGLGEAWTYLRTPGELSDGQRWRAKLAMAMFLAAEAASRDGGGRGGDGGGVRRVILCADEFAAVLDRITAMIVARTLRRLVRSPLSAVLATSHDDLLDALRPDVLVRCDFGRIDLSRPSWSEQQ